MFRVNALAPGITLTQRVSEFLESGYPQSMIDRHLLGRRCQRRFVPGLRRGKNDYRACPVSR